MQSSRTIFLERLSKRIGFDAEKAAHAISWLFSTQVFASAAGFLLTVALANVLTETDFGIYKYLMTLAGVVAILSLSGLGASTTRAVAQGYEGELKHATALNLRWSGGMITLALGMALYYLYMGNETLGYGALVLAVATPLYLAFSLFSAYLNGKEHYRALSITGVIYTIVPPLATVATLFLFSQDILTLFLVYMIAQALTAISMYYTIMFLYRPHETRSPDGLSYGKHLSLMNILGALSFQMDKLLTWHFLGPVQLAAYAVVTAPPQQLRYFNKIINAISVPKYSTQSMQLIRGGIFRKAIVLWLFGLALIIPYWLLAPTLFSYVFPKYTEYVLYSQVFSLVMLFFPVILLQGVLTAKKQTRALYWIQTLVPMSKIALLFLTLPFFGLWGVFVTLLTVEVFRLLLAGWFFSRIPIDQ